MSYGGASMGAPGGLNLPPIGSVTNPGGNGAYPSSGGWNVSFLSLSKVPKAAETSYADRITSSTPHAALSRNLRIQEVLAYELQVLELEWKLLLLSKPCHLLNLCFHIAQDLLLVTQATDQLLVFLILMELLLLVPRPIFLSLHINQQLKPMAVQTCDLRLIIHLTQMLSEIRETKVALIERMELEESEDLEIKKVDTVHLIQGQPRMRMETETETEMEMEKEGKEIQDPMVLHLLQMSFLDLSCRLPLYCHSSLLFQVPLDRWYFLQKLLLIDGLLDRELMLTPIC